MIFEKQIEKLYRTNLFSRQDNPYGLFYFTPENFPGLEYHSYGFGSGDGHDLKGYFYHYASCDPDILVVFDHGMGNGHRAYMREIEQLCRAGFLVFSYDHTGCMESGGAGTGGFARSLRDLDDCLKALKQEQALNDRRICVVGHSWGGYSTMNITALHPEITHVVSMSGFVSVERIVSQSFGGIMKGYRKCLMELERQANAAYVDYNAVRTLRGTQAKVLLVYSDDDKTVRREYHLDLLQQMLAGKKNIKFLVVHGKNHNPTYTQDAVAYKDAFFAEFTKAVRKKQLQTEDQQKQFMAGYDWRRMTEQDAQVWKAITDHLKD